MFHLATLAGRPPTAWEQPGPAAPTIERRRLEGAKCTMHSLPAAEQPMAGDAVLYGPAPAGGIVHRAREDVPTPTRKHQPPGAKSRRPGGDTGLLQPETVRASVPRSIMNVSRPPRGATVAFRLLGESAPRRPVAWDGLAC